LQRDTDQLQAATGFYVPVGLDLTYSQAALILHTHTHIMCCQVRYERLVVGAEDKMES
jgi:hypothetical protein